MATTEQKAHCEGATLAELQNQHQETQRHLNETREEIARMRTDLQHPDEAVRWRAAARLLQLEKEETERLGAVAVVQEQLDTARRVHLGERRAHHEQIMRATVQAFDNSLGDAAALNEEVRRAWNAAREDGVELDPVFWQFLLQSDGSQLSHWRRTVRSIGWLK